MNSKEGSALIKNLSEIEALAEEILADKEQIKNLDYRRNMNREALTSLEKGQGSSYSKKSWMCLGGTFMKYHNSKINEILLEDQAELDNEIKAVRDDLKSKVSKLHELEGIPSPKGFGLTALNRLELASFTINK